jgi:hypothetical protein
MSGLPEIQEAIAKLSPEEREELRAWFEQTEPGPLPSWVAEANARLQEIRSGQEHPADAFSALQETRREILG